MSVWRKLAFGTAKLMALTGGAILLVLMAVTCLSVLGRMLNTFGNVAWMKSNLGSLAELLQRFAPITGDFELVEMGIALAVFLFLPWCQLNQRHAAVHVFTRRALPHRVNALLLLVWEGLLVLVLGLMSLRLFAGMNDRMLYNETTFLLQWPVWWAYAACTIAGGMATLIGLYSLKMRLDALVNLAGDPP